MSSLDKAAQVKDTIRLVRGVFGWLLVGPALITMGVSQAMYGWAGNSLMMRVVYASACIALGICVIGGIGALVVLSLRDDKPKSIDDAEKRWKDVTQRRCPECNALCPEYREHCWVCEHPVGRTE